jgi:hypothetical protein
VVIAGLEVLEVFFKRLHQPFAGTVTLGFGDYASDGEARNFVNVTLKKLPARGVEVEV